jgi:hypothetical protein
MINVEYAISGFLREVEAISDLTGYCTGYNDFSYRRLGQRIGPIFKGQEILTLELPQ